MNKLFIVFLVGLTSSCFIQCQVPPFDEKCAEGKYPPDPTPTVPTYEIDLDLPPQLRWVNISLKYKKNINALVAYLKTFLVEINPKLKLLISLVDNDLGNLVKTLPAPYGEEIQGIAVATEANLGEIVLYNIFYEIFTFCTSIVAEDKLGNMLHARNLDFGLFLGWDLKNDTWIISEMLRPLIINVNYMKSGVLQYKTVSFAGFIGVITGIRPNSISITMNERFGANGGYIGLYEWILGTNRNQSWVTFLARDVLEKGLDFESGINALFQTNLLAPCYYIVGGPKPKQGAVLTRDRKSGRDLWRLGQNNTWFLVETNYDHWKAPLFIDDRRTPANKCMNQLGQDSLSFAGLFNVLSTKPVLNKLTVYTAIMNVKTGHLETYIRYCADPCWPF